MIFPRSIASPHRYAMHLPAGMEANSAGEAADALQRHFGPPSQSRRDHLDEFSYKLEDRDLRLYRSGSTFIGISSSPKPRVQAFFRPCSGFAGSFTGIGSATGLAFGIIALFGLAHARALASWAALYPIVSGICTPCATVPVGPYISAVSVARAGVLSITVTVDVTAQILCV